MQLAHEDGEHAVPLTSENFKEFVEGNTNVMVDFVSVSARGSGSVFLCRVGS